MSEDDKDLGRAETQSGPCCCQTYELRTHLKATDRTGCPLHGHDLRASASPREDKPASKPFVRGQKINIQNAPSSLEQSVAEWNRTNWGRARR